MKTRFSFKNHIAHTFFIYIAAIAVSIFVCTYSINLKTRPKDYERFSIFSEVEFTDEGALKDTLLNEVIPEDLKIDLYYMDKNDNSFNTYFSAYGRNSDICLLSKDTLDRFETIYFVNLKGTKWDKEDNYKYGDISVGIKYPVNNYFKYESGDYYLLVMSDSVHLDEITNGKTNQVKRVLDYLIK